MKLFSQVSIIALVPIGIAYIVNLISFMVSRKKLSGKLLDNVRQHTIQRYLFMLFVIAYYTFAILARAIIHIGDIMVGGSYYCIIASLIILVHLLIQDGKRFFCYSTNILALCSFIVGILLSGQTVFVRIAVSAIISVFVTVIFYIMQGRAKKFIIKPIGKKQFIASILAMSIIIAFSIPFNSISTSKINLKTEMIRNQLSGKTFINEDEYGHYHSVYVFDSEEKCYRYDSLEVRKGNPEYFSIYLECFGFGDELVSLDGFYYRIIYNDNMEIVALERHNTVQYKYMSRYELTDPIPEEGGVK